MINISNISNKVAVGDRSSKQGDQASARILILSTAYFPHLSGAEIAIQEITRRLKKEFAFDLICARFERKLPKVEKIDNVNVYRIVFGNILDKYILIFAGFFKALVLQRKNKYQLIHAIMATYGALAALFFKLSHPEIPFLVTIQEDIFEGQIKKKVRLFRPLYNLIFKKADFFQVIAKYMKERIKKRGFKAPIKVVPNGVDIKHFSQELPTKILRKLRQDLGIKEKEKVIITVSRLVKKKAVDDIIRAIPYLKFPIKFLVIGAGKELKNLQKLTRDTGIQNKVLFLGYVSHKDLPEYLKISDVFIRPSLIEGLGNSFLEAMAASVPIIATPIEGIPDFLKDRKTGLSCQVRSPKDIAQKIELLLTNNDLRQKIISQAKKLIEQKYNWQVISEQMRDIYLTLFK